MTRDELLDELIDLALGSEADNYEAYDGYVAEWLRRVQQKETNHE
jgi:hypothetical protein